MEVIGIFLRLFIVVLLSIILSVIAMQSLKLAGTDLKDFKQRNKPSVLAIAGFFNLLFIIAVAVLLKIWDHKSIRVLGFSIQQHDFIFLGLAFLLSISLALLYVGYLNSKGIIVVSQNKHKNEIDISLLSIIFTFIVLFIAALQEEILFRGYFAFVLKPYGFYAALLISAITFTAWHFITNKVNVFQTVDWFLGGIMLFCIYWFSGSIWIAALVHYFRNITNVLVFDISGNHFVVAYEKPIAPRYKTIYTISYSIIIIIICFYYYH